MYSEAVAYNTENTHRAKPIKMKMLERLKITIEKPIEIELLEEMVEVLKKMILVYGEADAYNKTENTHTEKPIKIDVLERLKILMDVETNEDTMDVDNINVESVVFF